MRQVMKGTARYVENNKALWYVRCAQEDEDGGKRQVDDNHTKKIVLARSGAIDKGDASSND